MLKNKINILFLCTFLLLGGLAITQAQPVYASLGPELLKITGSGCCGLWPTNLMKVGGTLFFTDYDDTNGTELWKSDGTSSGTVIVKDINPGVNDGWESNLTDVNGTLFFSANDGTNGTELWKSDGTALGTVMVKDINPTSDSSPWSLINANGTAYFGADDGTHGTELWKSDGTESGTTMVKDIYSGSGSSSPQNLTYCNGSVYFTAQPGAMMGSTMYKTDGTSGGTVALALPGMATPNSLFCSGSILYFTANNMSGGDGVELGKTDGTDPGTVLVKDINPGGGSSYPQNFADINGMLYFSATDGTNGAELWKSDGTALGTVMIKDINPGSGDSSPAQFFNNGDGTIYFDASDGPHGQEIWKTDGTSGGTTMVKDINLNNGDSWAGGFTNMNGIIYFDATNVSGGKGGSSNYQLWQTDGTEIGTVPVIDTNPGNDNNVGSLTKVNDKLFFMADDAVNGSQLWLFIPPVPPVASVVAVTGASNVGQILTGSYNYFDADSSPEGTSTFRWLRDGVTVLGTSSTYTVVLADLGHNITFEVTPVAQNGMSGAPVLSASGVLIVNAAPVASAVNITGITKVDQLLTGHYTYFDADGDLEGTSTFRWLINNVEIIGATSTTYTLLSTDVGKTIKFEVTPVALTGETIGTAVQSSGIMIPTIPSSSGSYIRPIVPPVSIQPSQTNNIPVDNKTCNLYITKYIKFKAKNDPIEVKKLQKFLKDYEGFSNLKVDGIYGLISFNAVKKFQTKYAKDILAPWNMVRPSGFVAETTVKKINELYCKYTNQ